MVCKLGKADSDPKTVSSTVSGFKKYSHLSPGYCRMYNFLCLGTLIILNSGFKFDGIRDKRKEEIEAG